MDVRCENFNIAYLSFFLHIHGTWEVVFIFVIRLKTVVLYLLILLIISFTLHFYMAKPDSLPAHAEGGENGVILPILMYHGITEDPKRISTFVISSQMFEDDLKYIQEQGYQTVTVDEVIRYVKNGEDLPPKPIMLTFDDGYYNNYCYAYPLLQKYNMKAVVSPIGKYTDMYSEMDDKNPAYAHITWENIREMMDSGLIEFQNHSYDLHHYSDGRSGAKKKQGESLAAYGKFLESDLMTWQEKMTKNTGYTPTTFTYPFGGISEASYEILERLGFQATLSCEEKMNVLSVGDSSCLQKMNRFLRSDAVSAKEILTK